MSKVFAYPYRTAGCLTTELTVNEPTEAEPDDNNVIRALEDEVVRLVFSLEVDLDRLESALPGGTDLRAACGVGVLIESASSRTRKMHWSEELVDRQAIALEICRADYFGSVKLTPAVLLKQGIDEQQEFAHAKGSVFQRGDTVTVQLDEADPPPGSGLRVEWRSFKSEPGLSVQELFALRVEQNEPIILLNSDHEGAFQVLESRGTHGANARIRDAQFHLIAHQVWTSLIASTLERFDSELDNTDRSADEAIKELTPWESQVLDDWAVHLLPPDTGEADRLSELAALLEEGVSDMVLERIPVAIQRRWMTPRSFDGLVRDLAKVVDHD